MPSLLIVLACTATLPDVAPADELEPRDTAEPEDTGEGPLPTLAEAMTEERLMTHLDALAEIGQASNDTRAWTTDGQLESADYVVQVLEAAGYEVWEDLHVIEDLVVTDASFETVTPEAAEHTLNESWGVFNGSAAGDVTAPVTAVDLSLPPGEEANTSTSGCQASDWDGFPAGHVALVQRGTCTFAQKVTHAEDFGASAVLIFNEGQPDRQGPIVSSLGGQSELPVLGLSYDLGVQLADQSADGSLEVSVEVAVEVQELILTNVVAESPGGDEGRVQMVGAHLDSVLAGPGLNDNGSGSALVLTLAELVIEAGLEPEQKLRFAFWDGEEYGLLGSFAWLGERSDSELEAIEAYWNYDMVASPNGLPFLYDGDGSTGERAPEGSDVMEFALQEGYEIQDLDWEETEPWVPTDSWGFLEMDIPSSGIFTGAYGTKTPAQAQRYGGLAGEPLDPCYHQLCDNLENIDRLRFEQSGKAAAHALETSLD
jgi:Zn-dependent M28 family amino/carboxypeptidase